MTPTFPIIIQNVRGPKPLTITGCDRLGHPRIVFGRMRKPDTLHWSAAGSGQTVLVVGLWRGCPRYGQFECPATELRDALHKGGFLEDYNSLQGAMSAWAQPTPIPIVRAVIPHPATKRVIVSHRVMFNESDCGGVFDGFGVTSDADPGL